MCSSSASQQLVTVVLAFIAAATSVSSGVSDAGA
jgi:hypothetical protein